MLTLADFEPRILARLAHSYGSQLTLVEIGEPIPGSYWDAPEAGLIGSHIFACSETPAHSLVHELGHYICMSPERRKALDTDAGGSDFEECAVCFLQLHLAEHFLGIPLSQSFADLDAWGYSFRLGSAQKWHEQDTQRERQWLLDQGLVSEKMVPTGRVRR